jgi:hypothetical protein
MFYSCASYERIYKRMEKVRVTETNIDKITGTYEMFAGLEYNSERGKKTLLKVPDNSKINFYNDITNKAIKIDSNSKYIVKVDCTKNSITFIFTKDKIVLDTINLKGKIKSNGFYYLDNSKISCHGIPYLFGGCQQLKVRLALSDKDELIVNQAYESSGAFLFFIWAGQQFNTCYFFKKIKTLTE